MVLYNFKKITVVPPASDFIDIILSKTQRQTPTVVHKGTAITRIRSFYMRKVKFTQASFHDKIAAILEDFPRVDDIHPFYGDLLNVLYDKDHYKLALGQLNMARNLIDRICKDYVRLLKYGDSLYRCKLLKKAALGRMCTLLKKLAPSLAYLEQVRQHMSRLPAIDPNTRTLILTGYPNVGKSSFMNKVTRADVEVQPYAFTTKSLFVGHLDYKYLRWQVIDTPGILDHPLEDRNTIEMQAITALAHLRACVLYVVDLSEQCGYPLSQQAALFHSIKPLFANKPIIIAANKTDVRTLEQLSPEDRALLEGMRREAALLSGLPADDDGATLMTMSTLTERGVMDVKNAACEKLLNMRVEVKLKGKKVADVLNRVHVATPKARDGVARPPVIPESVLRKRALTSSGAALERRRTEKDEEEAHGGAGVYSMDTRKHFMLAEEDWKYDAVPEILDGHNIADYVDPDILARLEQLEKEEEAAEGMEGEDDDEVDPSLALTPGEASALAAIKAKKAQLREAHRRAKSVHNNQAFVPRKHDPERVATVDRMREHLTSLGVDPSAAVERVRSRSQSRGRKRTREEDEEGREEDPEEGPRKEARSRSRSRSKSVVVSPGEGLRDVPMKVKARKLAHVAVRQRNKEARKGEGDRVILNMRPKHLFSGKRPQGTAHHR